MKKRLVLFDFDGTLTRKDTLFAFILYYHGWMRFLTGFVLLSPLLLLLKLGIIPNQRAKESVLRQFFGNIAVDEFNTRCEDFAKNILPTLVRKDAARILQKAREENCEVCIVSASPENWIKPWASISGIPCIATQLTVKNNKITGTIHGLNCYGAEKARRIREVFVLTEYEEIIAYGDSRGDREMLALAHVSHYKFFNE